MICLSFSHQRASFFFLASVNFSRMSPSFLIWHYSPLMKPYKGLPACKWLVVYFKQHCQLFCPFPPQEAINLLEPMTNDPVNYVRQGALIASALIMIQQTEVTCPKVCFGSSSKTRSVASQLSSLKLVHSCTVTKSNVPAMLSTSESGVWTSITLSEPLLLWRRLKFSRYIFTDSSSAQ